MGYEWSDSFWRLEKKLCTKFVPHSLVDEQNYHSQLVKNSSGPVRSAHVLSVTLWLENWGRYKKCIAFKGYYMKENKTVFFYFPCVPILVDLFLELYNSILYLFLLDIKVIFPIRPAQKLVAVLNEQYPNAWVFLEAQISVQCLCVS